MPKYLLSILFLFCLNAAAQTTAIPDANFEQFLFDQGIDTNGVNGNILDVDAQTVTALNVTRTDITDFTGLEAFVNLVTLNAGTNLVPTLPLTTLTLLEELRFARNTALATLNLTQNIALRVLEFNNDLAPPVLSVLDLSQNINLESLNIRTVRSITSLTLPVTATLTDIYVANLSVPTIDLSELTGDLNFRIVGSDVFVTIIYPNKKDALKRLELSSINFPTVDVSEMIGLERFGLYSTATENFILPSTNTLTNITIWGHEINVPHDLSIVPELTNLDIRNNYGSTPLQVDLTSNLELTSISLPNNLMNSVDLTQNTKLTRLDVSNNNFTTLDVTRNTLLHTFDANGNRLPTIDLSQNIELVYLRLHFNQFPSLDVTNNVELTLLNIGNNLFTGTGLDLSQNAELSLLYANNNQIESLDIDQNPKLRFLDISYNLFPGNEIINDFYDKIVVKANLSDVYFKANNNLLTGAIPDFYEIYTDNDPSVTQHRRWWFNIENNNFHFGDFENQHLDLVSLLTTQSIGPSADVVMREYTYAPQEKVNTIDSPARNAGESITLTTTVRGAQNHYKWFKDGVEITDAPDAPEYTIPDLNTCDAGVYHSEITSDLVPFENASPPGTSGKNLLLVRNDITLTVNATKDCVTLDMPLVNVPINSGIQWNDNPGACGYKISVGTTSGATDLVNDLDVGEVTVYNHSADFAPNQDIFITITPYYNDGDFSCAEQSFRTNATTVAPDCTILNAPENGDTNVSMNLSGISWNPANGADAYRISISSTSGNNNLSLTDLGNVLTHPFSTPFQNGDIVTVSIIPYNTVGDATGPCASESFTATGAASSRPFITTWETTTANETITIPTEPSVVTYNYTVDWGDGNIDTNVAGDITHTYTTPGIQTVSISETFPQIYFNGTAVDRDKILTIEQWGAIEWEDFTGAFSGCSRLNITNPSIDVPNLSQVTSLARTFANATSFNGDITQWDVSTVSNMVGLFQGASSFNQNIGSWNVSIVRVMDRVFHNATAFDQDIGNWNVEAAAYMTGMFTGVTLSTANYDALLIGWNGRSLLPNIVFDGGNSQYCDGAAARANMASSDNWTITDGGPAGAIVDDLSNQNHADSYTLPTITGTQLTGVEAYYTETNGGGTRYEAGDIINFADFLSYPITLYIYDGSGTCASEESFELTLSTATGNLPFITTWETTAANETITIPTRPFFGTYDYTIDWGDGTIDTNIAGDITHTYNTPGIQTVSITGTFPQIHFNGNAVDRDKILTIEQWGDIEWRALTQAFKGCSRLNITNPAIDIPNLSLASNISEAFADATSFNGDITLWDVGTITNMVNLFQRASSFNQDIGDWNVSNVISMSRLFEGATLFNQDIGDWNVGSVRSMNSMFSSTTFNQDIGDWNVSQVTNMSSMFISTTNFNQDIGNWNVSNVTNMDQMFYNATAFNQDISFKAGVGIPSGDAWDTGNVTSMIVMFYRASAFNQGIGNWNVGNVISMNQMFHNAINFDQDVSNWDVSGVTDMSNMFNGVTLSTANYDALLIGWNTRNLQPNVRFSGGFSQYCDGVSARANMIASDTWIITDGGLAGPTVDDLADQNQANSYTLPAITGTQLTGAEAYYTEITGGGTRYEAGDIINFADFLSYPVTLYIYDGYGSCSSEESFQLTLTSTGAFPSCTTLSSPIDNAIDIAEDLASISWNAAANADGYRITVAGSTSNLNDVTDLVVNGTSHPFTNDFDAGETVTITITPFNADGDASGCIAESFIIAAAATLPSCTTLSNPLNGATNVPTNITLTWNSVTDVDGYLVQIGTSPGNTDFSNQDVGNTTSIDLNGLPENTTFYITIVPYNDTGNATGCIEESFTTITGESRPDCTTLSSPINGETDVALNASINWNTVSNAAGYRITVGSINGGGELANNQDMGNTTTFTFGPGFIESVTYYVTVMPYNAAGQALGCSEESFTTVPPRMSPSCTSLISPLNLAIDVAVDTNIAWNVVSEADGYRLTLGTTSGGNDILDNLDVENITTFDLPNNLPSNTEIFVSIIPYNSVGNASLCSEESFITEDSVMDDAPSCSILNLPSNGDTDVPVNTMIRWNAVGDIDGYLLSIGTTEGGSDILNNRDVGLTTSYEPTAELPPGQEIFVTITPYNAAVQAENCVTQSFTTIVEEEKEDETLYGFSPNGDGINDFWTIDGIESSLENTVFIYNRWGDLVFQIQGYNNQTNVFRGTANNKTQMGAGELPSGTYFFNIQVSGAHNLKKLQGFLVIKR